MRENIVGKAGCELVCIFDQLQVPFRIEALHNDRVPPLRMTS